MCPNYQFTAEKLHNQNTVIETYVKELFSYYQDQEKGDEPASEQQAEGEKTEQPEEDIDLNDPEVQAAATKIQAGFKGTGESVASLS